MAFPVPSASNMARIATFVVGGTIIIGCAAAILWLTSCPQDLSRRVPRVGWGERKNESLSSECLDSYRKKIDSLVAVQTEGNTSTTVSDQVFLRRTYLKIAGRIPTLQETKEFLGSEVSTKRRDVVNELLDSEGYVHGSFAFWADRLRLRSITGKHWIGAEFVDWVKSSLRENMPYDRMVYELMTAQGFASRGNPIGYRLVDRAVPIDHVVHSIEAFLGIDIRCAQCHDHPEENISQRSFYGLAAYLANIDISTRMTRRTNASQLVSKLKHRVLLRSAEQRATAMNLRMPSTGIYDIVASNETMLRYPIDYGYADAEPGDIVEPSLALFGEQGCSIRHDELNGRETLALWMISPQNERFLDTIISALWEHVIGVPLLEDIHNLEPSRTLEVSELVGVLRELLVKSGFDLKAFQQVLYQSEVYQRPVADCDDDSGRILERMTAEQVWDSIVALIIPDLDQRGGYGSAILDARGSLEKMRSGSWIDYRGAINAARLPTSGSNEGADGEIRLLDSAEIADDEMAYWSWNRTGVEDVRWESFPRYLVRASETVSPAPATHILRHFGQSERDEINGRQSLASVQQTLDLMNASFYDELSNPNAVVQINLVATETIEEKIEVLYLSILNRRPTSAETNLCLAAMEGDQTRGTERVTWALLNSPEFLFIR